MNEIALKKLQNYCAYQERCHQEVRNKLLELKVYGDDLEEIIAELILENFLNEERFAKTFAGGKFRIKKWGRVKIRQELKMRHISEYCIRQAMLEIEEDDYLKTLSNVLEKRKELENEPNEFRLKAKLAGYAIGRGFEAELVWEVVNEKVF